jgi:hypothetical protein
VTPERAAEQYAVYKRWREERPKPTLPRPELAVTPPLSQVQPATPVMVTTAQRGGETITQVTIFITLWLYMYFMLVQECILLQFVISWKFRCSCTYRNGVIIIPSKNQVLYLTSFFLKVQTTTVPGIRTAVKQTFNTQNPMVTNINTEVHNHATPTITRSCSACIMGGSTCPDCYNCSEAKGCLCFHCISNVASPFKQTVSPSL